MGNGTFEWIMNDWFKVTSVIYLYSSLGADWIWKSA